MPVRIYMLGMLWTNAFIWRTHETEPKLILNFSFGVRRRHRKMILICTSIIRCASCTNKNWYPNQNYRRCTSERKLSAVGPKPVSFLMVVVRLKYARKTITFRRDRCSIVHRQHWRSYVVIWKCNGIVAISNHSFRWPLWNSKHRRRLKHSNQLRSKHSRHR